MADKIVVNEIPWRIKETKEITSTLIFLTDIKILAIGK